MIFHVIQPHRPVFAVVCRHVVPSSPYVDLDVKVNAAADATADAEHYGLSGAILIGGYTLGNLFRGVRVVIPTREALFREQELGAKVAELSDILWAKRIEAAR